MKKPRLFLVVAVCLWLLVPFGAIAQSAPGYPIQVRNFAHRDTFPAQCAGYRRGDDVAYAPALADYSIGYNLGSQHTAVTLFFYRRHGEILLRCGTRKRKSSGLIRTAVS